MECVGVTAQDLEHLVALLGLVVAIAAFVGTGFMLAVDLVGGAVVRWARARWFGSVE